MAHPTAADAPQPERRPTAAPGADRWRPLLWAGTLAWVGALSAQLGLFAYVGEAAWPVVLLLYLPRLPWVIPGLVLLPAALRRGRRLLLLPLAAGFVLWLLPVMGFVLPHPVPPPSGPTLRVLSYNTGHGTDGLERLRELAREARPDLVLFQWTSHEAEEALRGPGSVGWTIQRLGQFTVASRYPIRSLEPVGPPATFGGAGPPCAHAVIETPLGTLDVFNIRPQSARAEIAAKRKLGLGRRLGEFLADLDSGRLARSSDLRETQTRAIAEAAARASHPVIIAGDSNLPDGSLLLQRTLGGYRDAFVEAGWGFGYTHHSRFPWMRLDRVLLGPGLGATAFQVLGRRISAHRAIVADLVRVPGGPG